MRTLDIDALDFSFLLAQHPQGSFAKGNRHWPRGNLDTFLNQIGQRIHAHNSVLRRTTDPQCHPAVRCGLKGDGQRDALSGPG